MSGGWETIESDAGVFTYLLEKLGVKDVQCDELIALDPQMLEQLTPLYGVIFLFKYPTSSQATTSPSTPQDGTFAPAAPLFFANQVIQNACGTQALLSILFNHDSRSSSTDKGIDIGPHLQDFLDFTSPLPADVRGEALSNTDLIRSTHNSFARASPFADETQRQADPDADVYHFIAYTAAAGQLWELDGLQPAPISHGACADDQFPVKVVDVLQRRVLRYPEGEIRFNLLAVTRDLRLKARELGDAEWEAELQSKRRDWAWENALRRHNFVGFAGEVAKTVAAQKVKEGAFEEWVDGAKVRTKKRAEDRRSLRRRKAGTTAGAGGQEDDEDGDEEMEM